MKIKQRKEKNSNVNVVTEKKNEIWASERKEENETKTNKKTNKNNKKKTKKQKTKEDKPRKK